MILRSETIGLLARWSIESLYQHECHCIIDMASKYTAFTQNTPPPKKKGENLFFAKNASIVDSWLYTQMELIQVHEEHTITKQES